MLAKRSVSRIASVLVVVSTVGLALGCVTGGAPTTNAQKLFVAQRTVWSALGALDLLATNHLVPAEVLQEAKRHGGVLTRAFAAARANMDNPIAADLALRAIATTTLLLMALQEDTQSPVGAGGETGEVLEPEVVAVLVAQELLSDNLRTQGLISKMNTENRDPSIAEWAELDRILKERLDALGSAGMM